MCDSNLFLGGLIDTYITTDWRYDSYKIYNLWFKLKIVGNSVLPAAPPFEPWKFWGGNQILNNMFLHWRNEREIMSILTSEMCNCKCEFDILFPLEEGQQIEFKMLNF